MSFTEPTRYNYTPSGKTRALAQAENGSRRGRPSRLEWLLVLALLAIGICRIVATYAVFSQTYDEPAHVAIGMEWLDKGTYHYEPMHPPLSRVAVALGPYLSGLRSFGESSFWTEGNRLLWAGSSYERTLVLARLGILPFFAGMVLLVWLWSRDLFGTVAGLCAAFVATMLPTVLAHSSIATTDMGLAATLPLATLAWIRWLEAQTMKRSVALGAAVALAVLSKLTALLFVPAIFGALLVLRLALHWRRQRTGRGVAIRRVARTLAVAGLVGFITLWAGYRFSLVSLSSKADRPHAAIDDRLGNSGVLHDLAYQVVEAPLPIGYFLQGVGQVMSHTSFGRMSFLLGEVRRDGWWYYFPVAFLVKTPIPVLLLLAVGSLSLIFVRERRWESIAPLASAVAVMLAVLPSNVNMGLRHILPIYAFVAIAAGAGASWLLTAARSSRVWGTVGAALLAWLALDSARVHPDYLAYFNESVRNRADRVLVFTDLDWGQDTRRLADTVRSRKIDRLYVALNNVGVNYAGMGMPTVEKLRPFTPVTGWIAADLYALRIGDNADINVPPDAYSWLEQFQPVSRPGPSVRLYHITEEQARAAENRLRAQRVSAASAVP